MRTDDFDYQLPPELIAQSPADPRDSCRLMVVNRKSQAITHRIFSDVIDYLAPGDLLVANDTRVLPARLLGVKEGTGGAAEVLLLKERDDLPHRAGERIVWECLVKPGRRLKSGARVVFGDGKLAAEVLETVGEGGERLVAFTPNGCTFSEAIHAIGEMPLPPYITRRIDDSELYQTVFSRSEHSAAAPTAGLHFTPELLERVAAKGVGFATVELQVGLDTFRTVTVDDPRDHVIHTERFHVPTSAADAVNATRAAGGRVFAVGTTSVRALESAWDTEEKRVIASEGATSLFILPGYEFGAVDALVTNFHVPRSSLMMLVSAFAGRELVMRAYATAIEERYRMLSFGDAMLFL